MRAVISLLLLIFALSCTVEKKPEKQDSIEGKIKIVATSNQVADLVREIGGEKVEVHGLLGAGVDPHLYKASEGDVRKMYEADIVAYSGLLLEGKMEDVFENMKKNKTVFAVADGIPQELLIEAEELHHHHHHDDDHHHHHHSDGIYDPHIWLDVSLWKYAAEYTKDVLSEYDSENSDYFNRNYLRYSQELDSLNNYILTQISELDREKRVLVTAHDAFNYFGKAYGLEVVGLQGISTSQQAGASDVQKLADFIVERQLPAIFIETSVSAKSILALKEAVKSRAYKTSSGSELYIDSLENPGTFEGSYIGMMKNNVDKIVESLSR